MLTFNNFSLFKYLSEILWLKTSIFWSGNMTNLCYYLVSGKLAEKYNFWLEKGDISGFSYRRLDPLYYKTDVNFLAFSTFSPSVWIPRAQGSPAAVWVKQREEFHQIWNMSKQDGLYWSWSIGRVISELKLHIRQHLAVVDSSHMTSVLCYNREGSGPIYKSMARE